MFEEALAIAYGLLFFVLAVCALAVLGIAVAGFLRWCGDTWRRWTGRP